MLSEIIFTRADLEEFGRVSGDLNPLHASDDYARRTPFGQRVVFGIQAALAGLGALPAQPGRRLARLVLDFHRPLFPEVAYRAEVVSKGNGRSSLRVFDGTQTVLRATATFEEGALPAPVPLSGTVLREEAVDRAAAEIAAGLRVDFAYAPAPDRLTALSRRHGLAERGIGDRQLAAVLACSYLVGMEIPGRRALFSGLTLDFGYGPGVDGGQLWCEAQVENNDERFDLVTLRVSLSDGSSTVQGEIKAFVRRPPVELDPLRLVGLPPGDALAGKVAVVIGGSRGLGAALALALARVGCDVTATFARSRRPAEELAALAVGAAGRLAVAQIEATDLAGTCSFRDGVVRRHGRVDILALCASPALLPLELTPSAVDRINHFVTQAVAMSSVPLASFLGPLTASAGRVLVFSSSAVRSIPPEWPHYVAAKHAIEGLARAAAAAFPAVTFTLLRPPRVLTDLTNTVRGHEGALFPEPVAVAIVRDLLTSAPGGVRVVEEFDR